MFKKCFQNLIFKALILYMCLNSNGLQAAAQHDLSKTEV